MPDILDEFREEMDRKWLDDVAIRLGVKPGSLRRLTKRPHVEYGDQFTADELKPLYHILKSYEPADGRRENTVEKFLRVLSDTNGIPVSTMKKWRSTLRSAPEVASPHRRNRTVSAQTLTESQEQGLRAEIIAARTRRELVTQQWVSSRAADIYRLGLYIEGAAPPAVSNEEEEEDDPLVDMPESEAQRTWRTDEGSADYWRMTDAILEPIVEAACEEEEEDAEFAADEHGDFVRLRGQFGRAWFRGFSKRMGLSLLVAHPKRRPDARPERDVAEEEFKLQIKRDFRLACHNDVKWINSCLNMDETAIRFVNTRPRTVESTGARDVQIAHEGNDKSCLTVIAWITPSGEKGPLVVVMKGSTYRCEATMRAAFVNEIKEGKLIITRSLSGWVDNGRAQWFLELADQWVQKVVPHRARTHVKTTVIWDVYASHRSEETKAKAAELGIDLRFIPAGKTDAIQPLDQAIFGELKSRARALAVAESAKLGKTQVKATDALRHFLAAWEAIEAWNIAQAWRAILG